MVYRAPTVEQYFALNVSARLQELEQMEKFKQASPDITQAILKEASKLAEGPFLDLNRIGDIDHPQLGNDGVTLPDGFAAAHKKWEEGGWSGLCADTTYGGQGLPFAIGVAVLEQLISANMAFSLCMLLTNGAIEALTAHASEDLKQRYLCRLISGEWTGTMNLTEPNAGSDVGALTSTAELHADGSYRIKGTKIFITWGDHDCASNIVHLVLARTPGAPGGTRGISMFLVPKFLVNDDGSLGERNDVDCVSIEHKLGLHGSPTCVMRFGERDSCVGYLVGEEMTGMRGMFTMMNNARIGIGLQGVAIAERAYQEARNFARERVQSRKAGSNSNKPVPIIEHMDVRRMLMILRSTSEAIRALAYYNAGMVDQAHGHDDPVQREACSKIANFVTPIMKGFCTDSGVEMTSIAIQVYGGMGYVEESGIPQLYRDIRIAPIYEGTNGIQAIDLLTRKLIPDRGAVASKMMQYMETVSDRLPGPLEPLVSPIWKTVQALKLATDWMLEHSDNSDDILAAATPYLRMWGIGLSAVLLAEQATRVLSEPSAEELSDSFIDEKVNTTIFYCQQRLPEVTAMVDQVVFGAQRLVAANFD